MCLQISVVSFFLGFHMFQSSGTFSINWFWTPNRLSIEINIALLNWVWNWEEHFRNLVVAIKMAAAIHRLGSPWKQWQYFFSNYRKILFQYYNLRWQDMQNHVCLYCQSMSFYAVTWVKNFWQNQRLFSTLFTANRDNRSLKYL